MSNLLSQYEAVMTPYDRAAIDWLGGVGRIPLYDYALRHRPYLKPDVPIDFSMHPQQIGVYQCQADEIVLMKSAQVGGSEFMISLAFWVADVMKGTVIYLLPTMADISDFSTARFNPAVECSDYFASIVVSGGKGGVDRIGLKRIGDRYIYLRSVGGKGAQLKSIPADAVFYDEVDEMNERVFALAEKRLESPTSQKRQVWTSTPTYHNVGIDRFFQGSDMRRWHVRCEGCNTWQPITIRSVVTEWDDLNRPMAWYGQSDGTGYPVCYRCKKRLPRDGSGRWIAERPSNRRAGFHLTKLASPHTVYYRAGDDNCVIARLQQVNEEARRQAWNQDLGEPYKPSGTRIDFKAVTRDYTLVTHHARNNRQVFMGVDVNLLRYCVIRLSPDPETGESPLLWHGEVSNFGEVSQLMERFNVDLCVVDAMPEVEQTTRFWQEHYGKVWMCRYEDKIGPHFFSFKAEVGEVRVDRTRSLDETFGRFYAAASGRGGNTLPIDIENHATYCAHLSSPVRMIETRQGRSVAVYRHTTADDYAHAENYCMIASVIYESQLGWTV